MILCSLSIQYIHIEYICVCVSCVFMFFLRSNIHPYRCVLHDLRTTWLMAVVCSAQAENGRKEFGLSPSLQGSHRGSSWAVENGERVMEFFFHCSQKNVWYLILWWFVPFLNIVFGDICCKMVSQKLIHVLSPAKTLKTFSQAGKSKAEAKATARVATQ